MWPRVNFTWDISFGSMLTALSVVVVALRFHRDWVNMITQHKMMWLEYCRRHHIMRDPDTDSHGD